MAIIPTLVNFAKGFISKNLPIVANYVTSKASGFFESQSQDNSPVTITQVIRENPRYQQAMVDYFQTKATREQELIDNAKLSNEIKLLEIQKRYESQALQLDVIRELKTAELEEQRQNNALQRDLMRELHAIELEEQGKIRALQRDLMRELQAKAIAAKLNELQIIWDKDNWFSKLSRQETEQILLQEQQQHRLLILVSPPQISADCPDSFHNNLSIEIRNQVKTFLSKNYPIEHSFCPVEFYGDYFKEPISDIDVRRLQQILGNIPTVILYSDITDYQVNFNIGFWGVENSNPYFCPMQPLDWEEMQETLKVEGWNDKKALRQIRQVIITIHQLLAAFFTDWYYLSFDPLYTPQLYDLATQFPNEWVQGYIDLLRNLQQKQRQNWERYQEDLKRSQEEDQKAKTISRQSIQSLQCTFVKKHSEGIYRLAYNHEVSQIIIGRSKNILEVLDIHKKTIEPFITKDQNDCTIHRVSLSPDNQLLAISYSDKNIEIFDVKTRQRKFYYVAHEQHITSLVFSRDSQYLISSSFDGNIKLWSTATGSIAFTLAGEKDWIRSLAIHPDEDYFMSCIGSQIKIWDIKKKSVEHILSTHKGTVNYLAISPNGQFFASGDNTGLILVWDWYTKQVIHQFKGHQKWIRSLAFSPDMKLLVSGSEDKKIKVWDMETGELLHTLPHHNSAVSTVVFSSDGTQLFSSSWDGTLKIWECEK